MRFLMSFSIQVVICLFLKTYILVKIEMPEDTVGIENLL